MRALPSLLLLAGLLWCIDLTVAQDLRYEFSVDTLGCSSELLGDPGTTVRLDVRVILETARVDIQTWFLAIGGEGAGIEFGADRCNETCLSARLGETVQITDHKIVDPSLVPSTGPLAGSPQ